MSGALSQACNMWGSTWSQNSIVGFADCGPRIVRMGFQGFRPEAALPSRSRTTGT